MRTRTLAMIASLPIVLAAISLPGCASTHGLAGGSRMPIKGDLITRADIARTGATNAWDALRQASTSLMFRESSRGRGGTDRVLHRGAGSFVLNNNVLLVVDETMMGDLFYMREIPAPSVAYIQILSASEGTVRYGTPAGNGVIVVRTEVPPAE